MRRLPFTLRLALGISALAGAAATLFPVRAADRGDARPLPFLSDDYPKALGEARARARPLFIEAWAPW